MNKKQLQQNFKTNDRKSKVSSAASKGKKPIEYSMESGKLVEKDLMTYTSDSGLRPPLSSNNG